MNICYWILISFVFVKLTEKAEKIASILEKLYPKTPIPLEHYSAYTLLVAVTGIVFCTIPLTVVKIIFLLLINFNENKVFNLSIWISLEGETLS